MQVRKLRVCEGGSLSRPHSNEVVGGVWNQHQGWVVRASPCTRDLAPPALGKPRGEALGGRAGGAARAAIPRADGRRAPHSR